MSDDSLVEALSPELRALYEAGQVVVSEGRDPEKPVVRWAAGTELGRPGMLVKGSGVGPNHPDAVNSKKSGYKRRRGYRDAFELLIPDDTDPNVEMSIGAWVRQLWIAAQGGTVSVGYRCEECGHKGSVEAWKHPDPKAIQQILDRVVPKVQQLWIAAQGGTVSVGYRCEECGHKGSVEAWKHPDPKAIQQILDRVVPKVQQHEVTGQIDHLIARLDEEVDIREITVRAKDTKALPQQRDVIDG